MINKLLGFSITYVSCVSILCFSFYKIHSADHGSLQYRAARVIAQDMGNNSDGDVAQKFSLLPASVRRLAENIYVDEGLKKRLSEKLYFLQQFSNALGEGPVLVVRALSSDGSRAVVQQVDNHRLTVWNTENAQPLYDITDENRPYPVIGLQPVFSQDGSRMMSLGSSGSGVHLWDMKTGDLIRVFGAHKPGWQICSYAFTPVGIRVFFEKDNQECIFDVETGDEHVVDMPSDCSRMRRQTSFDGTKRMYYNEAFRGVSFQVRDIAVLPGEVVWGVRDSRADYTVLLALSSDGSKVALMYVNLRYLACIEHVPSGGNKKGLFGKKDYKKRYIGRSYYQSASAAFIAGDRFLVIGDYGDLLDVDRSSGIGPSIILNDLNSNFSKILMPYPGMVFDGGGIACQVGRNIEVYRWNDYGDDLERVLDDSTRAFLVQAAQAWHANRRFVIDADSYRLYRAAVGIFPYLADKRLFKRQRDGACAMQ